MPREKLLVLPADAFVIRFEPGEPGEGYRVRGRYRESDRLGRLVPPWPVGDLEALLANLWPGGSDRRHVAGGNGSAQLLSTDEIGEALFAALFDGDLGRLWHESVGAAGGRGPRLVLELDPADPRLEPLQHLPWELMRDGERRARLALDRGVVRRLAAGVSLPSPYSAGRPLRVLALVASPSDLPPIDLERERGDLAALRSRFRGVYVKVLPTARLEDLRQTLQHARLRGRPFRAIHLACHGGFDSASGEGVLYLEGDDGRSIAVSGDQLAEQLRDLDVALVVLNACDTAVPEPTGREPFAGVAAALIAAGIPAVVAMQAPIEDRAALAFGRALYRRLASGDGIDAAVVEGRIAIVGACGTGSAQWALPVLFRRGGDGLAVSSTARRRRVVRLFGALAAIGSLAFAAAWSIDRHGDRQARGLVERAADLVEQGDVEAAYQSLLAAVAADPGSAEAHNWLALVEARHGRLEQAVAHARRAVELEPEEATYHFNLGSLLAETGRDGEAVASLRQALVLDPSHTPARNELGRFYLASGLLPEARRELELAVAADPDLAAAWKNLGRVALAEGRAAEAASYLGRALELYPSEEAAGRAEAATFLAKAESALGHSREACRALGLLRALDLASIEPWSKEAAALAAREGCPSRQGTEARGAEADRAAAAAQGGPPQPPKQPAEADRPHPSPETVAETASVPEPPAVTRRAKRLLTAVVADFSGVATIVPRGTSSPERGPTPLEGVRRFRIIAEGDEIVVAAAASLTVVCSTDQIVQLHGPARRTLGPALCRTGRRGSSVYRALTPGGGRLWTLGHVYHFSPKSPARGHDEEDLAVPVVLAPLGDTLEERPTIVWRGVEDAVEYEIAIVREARWSPIRRTAADVSCASDTLDLVEGTICSMPWFPGQPGLSVGQEVRLVVRARTSLGGPWRAVPKPSNLRRQAIGPSMRAELTALEDVPEDPVRQMLEADIYARHRLWTDAAAAYRDALDGGGPPEASTSLGDVYLSMNLFVTAAKSYEKAFAESGDPAAHAAAELGLGLLERAHHDFDTAQQRFERARDLYRAAGYEKEAAEAERLLASLSPPGEPR